MTVRAVMVSGRDFEKSHPGVSWRKLGLESKTLIHQGLSIPVLGAIYDAEKCDFGYLESGFHFVEDPEIFLPATFTARMSKPRWSGCSPPIQNQRRPAGSIATGKPTNGSKATRSN
jgi:hypothetical protein